MFKTDRWYHFVAYLDGAGWEIIGRATNVGPDGDGLEGCIGVNGWNKIDGRQGQTNFVINIRRISYAKEIDPQ